MTDSLAKVVDGVGHPRVLVVGDVILDKYLWGTVDRISPEAPIQILDVNREEDRAGGAGNVAVNLACLDARVRCMGVVGDDGSSRSLLDLLREQGVDTSCMLTDPGRPTTVKTRMIAHAQQVLRVDREEREPLGSTMLPHVSEMLGKVIPEQDAVLVSDYAKGLLTPDLLKLIFQVAADNEVPVLVDPKGSDFTRYCGASLLTPNRSEAERVLGRRISISGLEADGEELRTSLGLPALVVTLGKEGISLFREGRGAVRIPARARAVYDVSGAGDTVLAALGLCKASGIDDEEAIRIANVAAGIVVGKVGTAQVTRRELSGELRLPTGMGHEKILDRGDLVRALESERRMGRRIAFTNGCFDLLHPGHLAGFEFCRKMGDLVVVGVNSDDSVRRLKGRSRPILSATERCRLLAGLADVDFVTVFDDDTPLGLIEAIQPHVLVKGADWKGSQVVGREIVESSGGEVAFCPLVEGMATTNILERIRNSQGERP